MIVEYNGYKKKLGLEYEVLVPVPRKIARRITMLAKQLDDREKK